MDEPATSSRCTQARWSVCRERQRAARAPELLADWARTHGIQRPIGSNDRTTSRLAGVRGSRGTASAAMPPPSRTCAPRERAGLAEATPSCDRGGQGWPPTEQIERGAPGGRADAVRRAASPARSRGPRLRHTGERNEHPRATNTYQRWPTRPPRMRHLRDRRLHRRNRRRSRRAGQQRLGEVARRPVARARSRAAAAPRARRSSCAMKQRGWKRQPDGGFAGLGTSPFSTMRWRRAIGIGHRDRRQQRHGVRMARLRGRAPRSSRARRSCPRYITATRSLMCSTTDRSCAMKR